MPSKPFKFLYSHWESKTITVGKCRFLCWFQLLQQNAVLIVGEMLWRIGRCTSHMLNKAINSLSLLLFRPFLLPKACHCSLFTGRNNHPPPPHNSAVVPMWQTGSNLHSEFECAFSVVCAAQAAQRKAGYSRTEATVESGSASQQPSIRILPAELNMETLNTPPPKTIQPTVILMRGGAATKTERSYSLHIFLGMILNSIFGGSPLYKTMV